MKCGQAEKWMDAALDELSGGTEQVPAGWSAQRSAELETHLAACPTCHRQWEVLRSAEAVLRVPKPVPAPESLLADFRQRLAEEERREALAAPPPRRGTVGWRWVWPVGSLAAAGLAAAVVLMFNIQPTMTPVQEIHQERVRGYASHSPVKPADEASPNEQQARIRKPSSTQATTAPTNEAHSELKQNRVAITDEAAGHATSPVPRLRREQPSEMRVAETAKPPVLPKTMAQTIQSSELRLDVKDAPHPASAATAAEPEVARQVAPLRPEVASPGKPVFGREGLESVDKVSGNVRPRGDLKFGVQKQAPVMAGAPAPPAAQSKSQSLGLLYSNNNTSQLAQNNSFYYAQVPAEPTPVELNVSAAVLNALQRPVELRSSNVRVQDLAEQLATEADVEVKVDPKVAQLNVSVDESGVPLWRLLEDVARQTQMVIYPRDNSLELRPWRPAAPAPEAASTLALKPYAAPKAKADYNSLPDDNSRYRGLQSAPKAVPEAPKAPAVPAGPRGPAGLAGGGGFGGAIGRGAEGPNAGARSPREEAAGVNRGSRYAYSNRQPDRKIWPAAWGNLPERGFEVPTAEELPPLILAPVQLGTTLKNEVPQVRTRKEIESEARAKAKLDSRQIDSKKLPKRKKPGR